MECHFVVPRALLDVGLQAEELLAEDAQSVDHVEIGVGYAKAQTTRVQGAVAHEVADQLSQLHAHLPRRPGVVLTRPVGLGQRRQGDVLR